MTHPAWKKSVAKRAYRVRQVLHARLRELSDDVISARLEVPRGTLHKWALRGKWK